MQIRDAQASDAQAVSDVLQELFAGGKRQKAGSPEFALSHYIGHPDRLQCYLAVDDEGEILGFQSLKVAREGNPYGTPVGWGIIGTHIRPSQARKGIGSRLFAATREAAKQAGLPAIEAYIGTQNDAALTYYEAMGFKTFRCPGDAICKFFPLVAKATSGLE